MATALSLRSQLEEECECSFCLEILQDPRVFPQCQHSFCYQCIEQLSQGKSKIFCPECRAEVEVNNIRLRHLLAAKVQPIFFEVLFKCDSMLF